jgi:putative NADH-flavin reductase
MKIALIGATGKVGGHVAREAQDRGHEVLALVRGSSLLAPESIASRLVDIFDPVDLAQAVRGADAIVSAYGAPADALQLLRTVAVSMVGAARQAGLKRVVAVGGAGVLEVAPGLRLGDRPDFPEALKPKVVAHADAIAVLRDAPDLDWTCLVPASEIGPGPRIGRYRNAVNMLVSDMQGRSSISYSDFACALVDEMGACCHPRQVVGVGY